MAVLRVTATTAVTAAATLPTSQLWTELLATVKLSGGAPTPGSVVQSAAGGQDAASFTVVTKLAGAASVRLAYSTSSSMTSPSYVSAQTPDSMGYVRHTASGLAARTKYYYRLADTPAGGSETLVGPVGQARTLPASGSAQSFTVALWSCVTQAAADPVGIDDLIAWDADLNICTGDFDYSGTTSTSTPTQVGVYETQIAGSGTSSSAAVAAGYPSAMAQLDRAAVGVLLPVRPRGRPGQRRLQQRLHGHEHRRRAAGVPVRHPRGHHQYTRARAVAVVGVRPGPVHHDRRPQHRPLPGAEHRQQFQDNARRAAARPGCRAS